MATTENKNYNLIDPMSKIDISPYNDNFESIDRDMAEITQTANAAKTTAENAKKQVEAAGGKIMTTEELGVGKVDGKTINASEDGTLSVIAKAEDIPATDQQNLLGDASSPTIQALIDAVANKVVNELVTNSALTSTLASYMTKSLMSSVNADNSDMVPTLALTNSIQNAIDTLNSKTEAKRPYLKDIEPTTPGGFGAWGMAISGYPWTYGTFISDNYYIGVDSNFAVYVGLQVNGHTDITWKKITS